MRPMEGIRGRVARIEQAAHEAAERAGRCQNCQAVAIDDAIHMIYGLEIPHGDWHEDSDGEPTCGRCGRRVYRRATTPEQDEELAGEIRRLFGIRN